MRGIYVLIVFAIVATLVVMFMPITPDPISDYNGDGGAVAVPPK